MADTNPTSNYEHYANVNGERTLVHWTDTSVASLCCGFAVRSFVNGADVCENCGQRCDFEVAPEEGAPTIVGA